MQTPVWRLYVRAAWAVLEEALLRADAYLAAVLDTRPLSRVLLAAAAGAGRAWRRHLSAARACGPGRGVIAVIITRPTNRETEEGTPHER